MPYGIKKSGDVWIVYKLDTGKEVAKHDSKEKAQKQVRLLYGIEGGWQPTKAK
jgi:hypothetical protein